MVDEPNNIVLQDLRAVCEQLDTLSQRNLETIQRLGNVEVQLARMSVRVDRIDMRLDRVERRSGLIEV